MKTFGKVLAIGFLFLLSSITAVFADWNATIPTNGITLADGGTDVAVYANPIINITISNTDVDPIDVTSLPAGFITCTATRGGSDPEPVFSSDAVSPFIVPAGQSIIAGNLKVSNIIAQAEGQVVLTCTITIPGETNITDNVGTLTINIQKGNRFDSSMNKAITPIKTNLDASPALSNLGGGDTIKNYIFTKVMDIVVPIMIILGILLALIGFYKMMFSSGDDAMKEGTRYVIYGIIGVLLIMSAKYLATILFSDLFGTGSLAASALTEGAQGVAIAQVLYEKVAYPFLKIAIYLVLGFMFVVLLMRVFSFFLSGDDSAKKKAGTIITWNVIGMLIIIGGKQLIEAVYGKKDQVLNTNAQTLGEIGSGILADKTIPILYQVINWVMGLAALVVLILIILQTVQLLMKPDDANILGKIKKSILYIFIGVLVIGAGYLLTNFLIVN